MKGTHTNIPVIPEQAWKESWITNIMRRWGKNEEWNEIMKQRREDWDEHTLVHVHAHIWAAHLHVNTSLQRSYNATIIVWSTHTHTQTQHCEQTQCDVLRKKKRVNEA